MQARPEPPAPEKPKNTDLIETTASDDPLQQHLQHLVPAEVSESIPPTTDPPFPTFNFASFMTGMAKYSYGSLPYSTVSPYSPPLSVYPADAYVLTCGRNGVFEHIAEQRLWVLLFRTSLRSRAPCAITPSVSLPSVVRSGRGRNGRPTKHGDPTNNDRDPILAHGHAASHSQLSRSSGGRDELRASYLRLKDAVPTLGSHQKLSKVVLLDRATTSINSLEKSRQQLLAKIREVEEEGVRLRQANEALALSSVAERPAPAPPPP
ncbi:hypothetical protein EDB86DRAFT_3092211 [Lactarius hatsudake]|nr:hypothetical protein EDB86DRAFT_3092211 [Lactarius hatsudake]